MRPQWQAGAASSPCPTSARRVAAVGVLALIILAALLLSDRGLGAGAGGRPPSPPLQHLSPAAAAAAAASSLAASQQASARCAIPAGRRLAIVQVKWWHTEVFGMILEFARTCGHDVTIFHAPNHATSALPLYEKLFAPLKVRPPDTFRAVHADFDAIFFTTPDDDIDENFRKSQQHRTIYAAHMTHPKFLHRWHTLRLHMTPLAGFPFVVPVFAAGLAAQAAVGRERTVAMVGTVHDGSNYNINKIVDFARRMLAAGWRVVIFTRHWGSGEEPPPGLEMVRDATTEQVHERLRRIRFVLIFPGEGSWYTSDRITGALPLAVSVGTPVVTTQHFADIYGLSASEGVVAADGAAAMADALVRAGDDPTPYAALVAGVESYRARLLRNNVAVIELVMLGVPAIAAAVAAVPGAGAGGGAGGGFRDIVPLAPGFPKRATPEIGC